jgi:hypothetical protein
MTNVASTHVVRAISKGSDSQARLASPVGNHPMKPSDDVDTDSTLF